MVKHFKSSLVILAALVFEILCRQTDRQTKKTISAKNPTNQPTWLQLAWVKTSHKWMTLFWAIKTPINIQQLFL